MSGRIIKCYINTGSFTPYDPFVTEQVQYVPSRVCIEEMWGEYVQRDVLTSQGTKRLIFKVVSADYGRCIDWTIGYCMKLESVNAMRYGPFTTTTASTQLESEEANVDTV